METKKKEDYELPENSLKRILEASPQKIGTRAGAERNKQNSWAGF